MGEPPGDAGAAAPEIIPVRNLGSMPSVPRPAGVCLGPGAFDGLGPLLPLPSSSQPGMALLLRLIRFPPPAIGREAYGSILAAGGAAAVLLHHLRVFVPDRRDLGPAGNGFRAGAVPPHESAASLLISKRPTA